MYWKECCALDKEYQTERLILKLLDDTEYEAKLVLDYFQRNHEHFKPWDPLRGNDFYSVESRKEALKWEKNVMKDLNYLRLWIFRKDDLNCERIIGTIGLTNIIRGTLMTGRLGYSIDREETNKGYMSEAVKKALEIAFNEYGLHRIEATIMPENKPSLRLAEKLGFVREGLFKKYQMINGKWEDHICMALINESHCE
jgi:ribosomal-protein-alanine N-acetyltransferase